MDYVKLGESDVEVSQLILGTWAIGGWMWGGTDDDNAVEAIRKAVDLGMTTIDTAPIYGFGHSELIVGEAVRGRREEVQIATKCGLNWERTDGERPHEMTDDEGNTRTICRCLKPEAIIREMDQSLERLGTDYVDLYQCHWPDSTTPIKDTMGALNQLLAEGKTRAVGVSNFTVEMLEECLEHGPLASDQPPHNMLDRRIEPDVLPWCRQHGVSVIVYSPMHRGLLTGKVTMDREFEPDDHRARMKWFQPQNRRRVLEFLDRVRPVAEAHDRTLAQLAVNWAICQPGVTAALVGARTPEQAEENVGGAGWRLTDEELAQIGEWLHELGEPE